MSKPIAITQRQITAICKGAARAGFVAEIIINGVVVRLVPEGQPTKPAGRASDYELDAELESWDGDRNRSKSATGPGGYPSGSGRKGDPLQDYYDRLGFDPLTMGQREMMELQKAAEEKWKASIPGTPLGKRERNALKQLSSYGPNIAVHWIKIKNCGDDTAERLKARGFLETTAHPKHANSFESLILTDAGHKAFRALQAEQS
ncbi:MULTISPECIES: hypothetical protein [unclassified Mesorhizobium]|uniref:hypothetical protein n=1 Tax=unclassified Mesorhizobium TaxID=325217 RepID=UPI000FE2D6A0|nr:MULTISPECIES: hypothetical protein [unclassified Mesorhizobium]RWX62358.1 hypothetical protein EN780_26865 [Mesorhizobium sp. M4B.F.Ca.ET.089.01.1.1]TGT32964.1 hypothetical protein EN815_11000 [Mesorhizobium sp. M4B.F.Ca.ET.172.01.1.1]